MGWALVPLLTVGLGSPLSFLYAAARHRSAPAAIGTVAYGAGVVGAYMALTSAGDKAHSLGLLLFLATWIISTAHAMIARPRLYPVADPRDRWNQGVLADAKRRRALRLEARRVLTEDPSLAHELRIGRPDLPRAFDDGGLIDVNHAPPPTLGLLPGLSPELVHKIVTARAEQGSFISAEELAVHADLPPDVVPGLVEYGLFLR